MVKRFQARIMMNEWKQLLKQTHPGFQSLMTIDEAIDHEKARLTEDTQSEIEWISPTNKLQDQIENIPDKMGFKIGEAADYVGVKQYVLRYWESEFDILKPKKSKNGQRMYTQKDVETALLIKKLLHEDRFSIEGARSALKKLRKQVKEKPPEPVKEPQTLSNMSSQDIAGELLKAIQQARLNLGL